LATKETPAAKAVDPSWDELPSLTGVDEIVEYINKELGIPIRRYRVVQAIQSGTLPIRSRMIGNYASARPIDVRRWLAGGAK
jgi:hypothetical protein